MRVSTMLPIAGLILCGCGGSSDNGSGPGPVPASVTVAGAATGPLTTIGETRVLTATVRDGSNNELPNETVTWSTANAQVVSLSATTGRSVTATAVGDGTARVTAKAGSATGTIDLTVAAGGFSNSAAVTATSGLAFSPSAVDIAVGGTVTWTFQITHNVTFETAGAPSDIGNTSSGSVSRTFNQAGTFPYQCTIHPGMSGTVRVH
ncbi:MAG TPA: plastocyanin/azurin family copper-binding protein [Gemmatimonadaceae bacterium]|nr:plastocyanin/azurin family copper-binding protein [Gemmatimonadaceae bacterium]